MARKARGKFVPHTLAGTISLAANTSDTISLQTAGFVYYIRGIFATSTGAFSLQITPTDTNKQLFSISLPHTLVTGIMVGTGANGPFRIDGGPASKPSTPLRVAASTTIILEVLDTSGAPNVVTIALDGARYERY